MPDVVIVGSPAPNAFAARTAQRTVIGVTVGALFMFDDDELRAVLAHEIGHIKHGDVTYLGWFVAVAAILTFLVVAAFVIGAGLMAAGGSGRTRKQREAGAILALGGLFLTVMSLVVGLLGIVVTRVIAMAALRSREFAADARSAALTQDPGALARALGKIRDADARVLPSWQPASALFTASAAPESSLWTRLFATHPNIGERIRRLEQMAQEIGQTPSTV